MKAYRKELQYDIKITVRVFEIVIINHRHSVHEICFCRLIKRVKKA